VIVGRLGTTPLGGLGVASQALTTLVGISVFLAYGTTAAVARQLGAGHREAALRQGIDGLWLAGIIGAVVLVALWLAFSLWLVARFVTLTLRARSSQWLVTGAVRR
jgi:Na+-driven multidrug efflux pump